MSHLLSTEAPLCTVFWVVFLQLSLEAMACKYLQILLFLATHIARQMSASRSLPGLLQTAGETLYCSLLTVMLRKGTVIYDV